MLQLEGSAARQLRFVISLGVMREWLDGWRLWLGALAGASFGTGGRCRSIEGRYRRVRAGKRTAAELLECRAPAYNLDAALIVEGCMRHLPERARLAIKAQWVVGGRVETRCAAVGVKKSMYYDTLRAAELMVRNRLMMEPRFRAEVDRCFGLEELEWCERMKGLTRPEKPRENPVQSSYARKSDARAG